MRDAAYKSYLYMSSCLVVHLSILHFPFSVPSGPKVADTSDFGPMAPPELDTLLELSGEDYSINLFTHADTYASAPPWFPATS